MKRNLFKAVTPAEFFAEFCEKRPQAAEHLMRMLLINPTGGVHILLPNMIEGKQQKAYYDEMYGLAYEYLLKPESSGANQQAA